MRTLSKPKNKDNKSKPAQTQDNRQGKKQSKKVVKTVFTTPFRYEIQTLSVEDNHQVTDFLLKYTSALRSEFKPIVKAIKNQQFISFSPKQKMQKPALIDQRLIFGIKQCISKLTCNQNMLVVLFYDKHQVFEEIMCRILHNKTSYLLVRDSPLLRQELGVKRLLALGLTDQRVINQLSMYCYRCLIDIPWLVDTKWIPLEEQK